MDTDSQLISKEKFTAVNAEIQHIVISHSLNPSTWETEVGRLPWVLGKSGLESENKKTHIATTTGSPMSKV